MNPKSITLEMKTILGKNVYELSEEQPILLVFLRHFGCVFCKEALDDLSKLRAKFNSQGVKYVLVHMAREDVANQYFEDFNLSGVSHISNPEKTFYTAFGLLKGTFSQLYGLRTWIRGFSASTTSYKLELAEHLGDSTQMPGMFLIHKGKILKEFVYKQASVRPDYEAFIAVASVKM